MHFHSELNILCFEKIFENQTIFTCLIYKYTFMIILQVTLSITLGKPVIPLLMEKMSWPPPGSMGPLFSEYLFVRFFSRDGEETGDERYWPTAKYTELLMQIKQNVAPDHKMVTLGKGIHSLWLRYK